MTDYRLLSFRDREDSVTPGILVNAAVFSFEELSTTFDHVEISADSILSVLQDWAINEPILRQAAELISQSDISGIPLDEIKLETPIQYPQALYCAGANYVDHLEEMTGKKPNKSEMSPFFFLKPPRPTLVASGTTVKIPIYTQQLDWEAEIALVIGQVARAVSVETAMDYVAGLTILNDLSARDLMKRYDVPFLFDWIGQKCFPGAAPTGPWITPLEYVDDPGNLDIKLWVNDRLFQDSNSEQMIFSHAELIANLSKHVTLYPGDIIATGTPAGVGHGCGEYLKSGDVVRIDISGLGSLRTPIE
jgi:2-keto-4-pentenoate hydratase/2-oxohepta-3-ene-1,7-dioic acid hydratase in catechol pathway